MIHYLPQNPEFSEEDTVLQSVQNMVHHHANENELIAAKAMLLQGLVLQTLNRRQESFPVDRESVLHLFPC